ncbi:MAG TPA: glycoside hydrolase family 16 protein [Solirubrobacterales bacterium]|nr:glycoside hydrolase family 16 protein [Solirubrobacterales bacterium]
MTLLVAAPDADAARPACGAKIAKPTGGSWRCTFADEFSGGALDRSKWSVMTTASSGFSHAFECYVDDRSTVNVANGSLNLTARKLSSPAPCGYLFSSPYQSGMVHTKSSFAQTYGRFEARIKLPTGRGLHGAWWMWPRDMAYGKQSGEIDIAEHYGAYPDIVSPYVHINDDGVQRGKGAYCNLATAESGFHQYVVEWLPLVGFRFIYDGNVCMTFNNWDPGAPLSYPQPFDKSFFLNLTLAMGWGVNSVDSTTPFPATMSVDYVRAWS